MTNFEILVLALQQRFDQSSSLLVASFGALLLSINLINKGGIVRSEVRYIISMMPLFSVIFFSADLSSTAKSLDALIISRFEGSSFGKYDDYKYFGFQQSLYPNIPWGFRTYAFFLALTATSYLYVGLDFYARALRRKGTQK